MLDFEFWFSFFFFFLVKLRQLAIASRLFENRKARKAILNDFWRFQNHIKWISEMSEKIKPFVQNWFSNIINFIYFDISHQCFVLCFLYFTSMKTSFLVLFQISIKKISFAKKVLRLQKTNWKWIKNFKKNDKRKKRRKINFET